MTQEKVRRIVKRLKYLYQAIKSHCNFFSIWIGVIKIEFKGNNSHFKNRID